MALTADDLVYYTDKENNIYSGGFNVNSILMKEGITFLPVGGMGVSGGGGGGGMSDIFKDLAIPGWVASSAMPSSVGGGAVGSNAATGILAQMQTEEPTTLYDKLLDLVASPDANRNRRKIKTYRRNRNHSRDNRNKTYKARK